MSRKNRHTRYSGNNVKNKPHIVIQSSSEDEQIFIQRGNLALVGEARPKKAPAPTPTTNLRNKAQSLSLDWDDNEALQIQAQRPLTEAERKDTMYEVYVGNTWVSSCVDVISKRFTSGGWHLEEVEEGKGLEPNKDALKSFLLDINDDEDFLQYLRGVADDLNIYGESYTEIILGSDGLPAQLVSIDCSTMTYELDAHGNITGYTQTLVKSNKSVKFKPEQIIRWWFPSKRARKVAFSPIEKLVNPTYADKSMVDWVQAFFRKGTRPSAWVKLGDDSDIEDARKFLKFYRENYTGEQNAHMPQVMYGGAVLNEYGKGSIDVDFNNGRLLSREEILAGYGVPPATIGIIESGNIGSGTGEDQDKALRNNTVDPIKQLILEKFNRRIVVGAFGITDWLVTTRYADYRSDVEISKVQQTRIFSGVSTPNQERIGAGKMPYKETGDTPVIVAGKEIIPLDRLDDLTEEQRQAAQVQIDTSKAALDLAQTQADKAKEPTPEPPTLNNGQQQQQSLQPGRVPGGAVAQGTQAGESAQQNTGMMVAFMVDTQTANKLAIPGGEASEDLHITLAYLGDKSDFKGNVAKLKETVKNFAAQMPILKGVTSGIARFSPSSSSGGLAPTVAMVNVHQLTSIRQGLVQSLRADEFEVASDFAYTPHITLSYNDISQPISPSVLPETPLLFTEMCLAIGDKRYVYPLGTETDYVQQKEEYKDEDVHHSTDVAHSMEDKRWQEDSNNEVTKSQQEQAQQDTGSWQKDDPDIQARLQDMQTRNVKALKWNIGGSNPCELCAANSGVTVLLGKQFPNGALMTPGHDHCECGTEEIMEQPKESVIFTKQQQFGAGAWQAVDPIIQQRLVDIQSRVKLTWKQGTNPCYACSMNNGISVPLGTAFPSGALMAPCHDGCDCSTVESME